MPRIRDFALKLSYMRYLHTFNIQLLVDVRSIPYSKYNPQFNYGGFKKSMANACFAFEYLGDKIGGKYSDPDVCFIDGGVDYSKVACLQKFIRGIDQLIHLSEMHPHIVIMCAEKDPYFCHRFALISRALSKKNVITHHILTEGSDTISNSEFENKMRSEYGSTNTLDELYSHHNRRMFHKGEYSPSLNLKKDRYKQTEIS